MESTYSADFLKSIINTIADPVFVKNEKHEFMVLNDAFCEYTDLKESELVGKTDYDFFEKEEADVFRKKDKQVFNTGETNINEEFITDAQGKQHTIVTKKSVFKLADGSKVLVGVITDITIQKQQQNELEVSLKANKIFNDILANDLLSSIRTIKNFSQLLMQRGSNELSDTNKEYLTYIEQGAEELHTMINRLADYSKINEGVERNKLVSLKDSLEGALSKLVMQQPDLQFEKQVGDLPNIKGNQRLLLDLFSNLLSNSVKFSKENEPLKIDVSNIESPVSNSIFFKDNGLGIPSNQIEHVLKLFTKIHPYNKYKGTGMGLSICKKIMELHGGNIKIDPEYQNGTCVVLEFPKT